MLRERVGAMMCKTCAEANRCASWMYFWKQGLIYLEKQVCIFAKYIQEFYLFLNAVRRGGAMMSKICAQANRCASYTKYKDNNKKG